MITVTVNGALRDAHDGTDVLGLVVEVLGHDDFRGVAVAVNDHVVPRAAWTKTPISDADRVEIVSATQGG